MSINSVLNKIKTDITYCPEQPQSGSTQDDSVQHGQLNPQAPTQDNSSNSQIQNSSNPSEYSNDFNDTNPQSKKNSSQEINDEIDLKKNRNFLIATVLVACTVVPMVLLGLMASGAMSVSSLIFFNGYGASEVVLGLLAISAISQISLSFVSKSGIAKVNERKPRVYDGINPSVEEDVYKQKLKEKADEENAKKKQIQANKPKSDENKWQRMLGSKGVTTRQR